MNYKKIKINFIKNKKFKLFLDITINFCNKMIDKNLFKKRINRLNCIN